MTDGSITTGDTVGQFDKQKASVAATAATAHYVTL
jgi:hypothetical protein